MRDIVHNMPNTTGLRSPTGEPWLTWHHEESGSKAEKCSRLGCGEDATVGGHVKHERTGMEGIVPLCSGDNHHTRCEPIALKERAVIVPLPGEIERVRYEASLTRLVEREDGILATFHAERERSTKVGAAAVLTLASTAFGAWAGGKLAQHDGDRAAGATAGALIGGGLSLLVSAAILGR